MGVPLYRSVVAPRHANCVAIQNAVHQYIARARQIFGAAVMDNVADVIVEFYPRGRNIALASWGVDPNTGKNIGILQFSYHHVTRKLLAMVKQIVPHEIAHIICKINGWDEGHGKVWRQVCMMLGGNGETFSTLGYVDGRLKNLYEAVGPTGATYWLTAPQRRTARSTGIIVQTEHGDEITLTADSLTGKIKPL